MDFGLGGKIALVSGATAGIGRAAANMLADEGARLVILGRREDHLETLATEIAGKGHERPVSVVADLMDPSTPDRVRTHVEKVLGGLDILINNAGAADPRGSELTEQFWHQQFELNFHQRRRMTEALEDLLKQSSQGRVITLAVALEPMTVSAAMSALGATVTWSKAYSRLMGPFNVTVNCVAPGRVESEQVGRLFPEEMRQEYIESSGLPLGRFGEAEEAAALITFLASARASYITGQCIALDGGLRRSI